MGVAVAEKECDGCRDHVCVARVVALCVCAGVPVLVWVPSTLGVRVCDCVPLLLPERVPAGAPVPVQDGDRVDGVRVKDTEPVAWPVCEGGLRVAEGDIVQVWVGAPVVLREAEAEVQEAVNVERVSVWGLRVPLGLLLTDGDGLPLGVALAAIDSVAEVGLGLRLRVVVRLGLGGLGVRATLGLGDCVAVGECVGVSMRVRVDTVGVGDSPERVRSPEEEPV